VTEYCPNGSLYSLLYDKRERLPITVLIKMARDIAAGILVPAVFVQFTEATHSIPVVTLQHLHKEHVIHRDIAARNVLVGDNYGIVLIPSLYTFFAPPPPNHFSV